MTSIITRVFDYMGVKGWQTAEVEVGGSQPVKSSAPFAFEWNTPGLVVGNGVPIGFTPSPTIIPILTIFNVTTAFDVSFGAIIYDDDAIEWNQSGSTLPLDEIAVWTMLVSTEWTGGNQATPQKTAPWNLFQNNPLATIGAATVRVVYFDLSEF